MLCPIRNVIFGYFCATSSMMGPLPQVQVPQVWFSTGSVPGIPEHTGQQREFGSPPNSAEQVQKTLDFVRSSA